MIGPDDLNGALTDELELNYLRSVAGFERWKKWIDCRADATPFEKSVASLAQFRRTICR